jgi:hypothetical protein
MPHHTPFPSCLRLLACTATAPLARGDSPCGTLAVPTPPPLKLPHRRVFFLSAGTGSELEMAVAAGKKLEADGKKVRVVSMPCWELFDEQTQEYK